MKNDKFQVEDLISVLGEFELTELEYEEKDLRVKIKKEKQNIVKIKNETQNIEAKKEEVVLKDVVSTEIGIFMYISQLGEKMISIGDIIKVNQVIGTAMVMGIKTPIKSTVSGEIVEIMVENGGVIDYGKPLIKVKVI